MGIRWRGKPCLLERYDGSMSPIQKANPRVILSCGICIFWLLGCSTESTLLAPDIVETVEPSPGAPRQFTPQQTTESQADNRDLVVGATAIEFSPNGKHFAAVGREIRIFETTTYRELWRVPEDDIPGNLKTLAFNPDGTLLAVGGANYEVFLFDVTTGIMIESTTEKQGEAKRDGLDWSPDGNLLAVDTGLWVGLFSSNTWTRQALVTLPGSSYGMTFSDNGETLLVAQATHGLSYNVSSLLAGGTNGEIVNWMVDDLAGIDGTATSLPPFYPFQVKYPPDGSVAAMSGSKGILVLDTRAGRHLLTLKGSPWHIWSPDGEMIAGMDTEGEGNVQVWDAVSGALIWSMESNFEKVCSLVWSPDGRTIAINNCGGVVFWNLPK